MAAFLFFNDILQAPAKPRQEGRRKSQKIRKAQENQRFSPTLFRFFRLFSAGIVGVGIFNFISFNAELFSFWDSFKQGVPGSIPGWLTKVLRLNSGTFFICVLISTESH